MIKRYIFVFVSLLFFFSAQAQDTKDTKKKDTIQRYNEIGLVYTEFIDGSFKLRYERKTKSQFSFAISAGYKGENGLINFGKIDGEKIKTGNISYSGFKILPEFRYYIKKTQLDQLSGFYVGGYLKYAGYKSDLNGSYTVSENEVYEINIHAKIGITTLGTTVGYKLAISDRFHLDFIMAGPGTSYFNFNVENNIVLPERFYDELNGALEKHSLFDVLNPDFNFKWRSSRSKFQIPSFRYGMTVGFTF